LRFALPDEDVGGRTQRFDLGNAGDLFDRAADPAHDLLHDAEIIEDRDQAGEEHDDGQRGNGEAVAADLGRGQRAEQEIGAVLGIAEQRRDAVRRALDRGATGGDIEDERRDHDLQRECGPDDAQADRAAIGRQQHRQPQYDGNPGDADQKSFHEPCPPPGERVYRPTPGTSARP
jgi:hypothetical protein